MKASELSSSHAAQEIHSMVRKAAAGELVAFLITLDTSIGEVETVSIGKDYSVKETLQLLDHVRDRLLEINEETSTADAEEVN